MLSVHQKDAQIRGHFWLYFEIQYIFIVFRYIFIDFQIIMNIIITIRGRCRDMKIIIIIKGKYRGMIIVSLHHQKL
jgi:hypothetical protein